MGPMQAIMNTHPEALAPGKSLTRPGTKPQAGQALLATREPQGSYLALLNQLSGTRGRFARPLALKISLLVSTHCGCHESAALFASAAQNHQLTAQDIALARAGWSARADEQALLAFVQVLLRPDGNLLPQDLAAFRQAGWSDEDAAEVFGHITLNYLTHHFWLVDRLQRQAPAYQPTA